MTLAFDVARRERGRSALVVVDSLSLAVATDKMELAHEPPPRLWCIMLYLTVRVDAISTPNVSTYMSVRPAYLHAVLLDWYMGLGNHRTRLVG